MTFELNETRVKVGPCVTDRSTCIHARLFIANSHSVTTPSLESKSESNRVVSRLCRLFSFFTARKHFTAV